MKIKAPFKFEPWSKVTKVYGRQCRRYFWLRDSANHPLQIIILRPLGYIAGVGYAWQAETTDSIRKSL